MASLTGQSISSSYEQLLALPDGGLNGTTLVAITDGDSSTEVGFKISTNALSMNSTNQLQFGDTGTYIHQSADGVLDLVSDSEIEINATTIDMNGALDLSGNAIISGNVGIGTAPSQPLHIKALHTASGDTDSQIIIEDTTAYNSSPASGITFRGAFNSGGSVTNLASLKGFKENATDGNYDGGLSFQTRVNGGNMTTAMTIDSSQNVGIGSTITNPSAYEGSADNLVVGSTSGAQGITIVTGNTSKGKIHFADGTTGAESYSGYLLYDHNGDAGFQFGVAATTRFAIDNNSRISLSNNDSGGTGGRDSTSGNTILGYSAGNVNSGAVNNTFIGHASGSGSINGGDNNTAIGAETLQALTTASGNQAIGSYSGFSITTGSNNVLIGNDTGFAMTETANTVIIGHGAGDAINNTGADGTVALGYQSLGALTSGQRNTAVGFESLKSNTIGDRNTAVGYQALESFVADTDAHGHNTAVGHNAMQGNVTGTDNTAIGNSSAFTGTNNMTAGDDNTFIGSLTAPSSATPTNQTVIGKGATGQANNSVTLGNADVTDVYMAQDSGARVHAGGLTIKTASNHILLHDTDEGDANDYFRVEHDGGAFRVDFFDDSTSTNTSNLLTVNSAGNVSVLGALSKGSGSFKIDHPLESKKDTHHLVHSFVEAPQADNIYRGKATLSSGSVEINLDTVFGMSEGTFVLLNTDIQCFTSNESDWDAVKGSVSGNILTISCQNTDSTANVSWLVIGERQDAHMKETDWTDENGKVIVEPEKNN